MSHHSVAVSTSVFFTTNVNHYVKVKLTEHGVARYKEMHGGREPTLDADGWYKSQMWSLFSDFGNMIWLGNCHLPFETTIQVEIP